MHIYDFDPQHPLLTINLSNITKLSSTNYLTWSLQIQSLLECYDLHHFINGGHIPPSPTVTITTIASPNPAYTTWKRQDRLIFSALLGAISVSLQPPIVHITTSLDAWQTLANTYAKPSRGHIKQLKERLQRCTKGSLTCWTYVFAITVYLINHQLVDVLTKPLPRSHFQELQVKIGVSFGAPS
ncbi:hypothetical protein AAG906_019737 [Vitis piasezkii]